MNTNRNELVEIVPDTVTGLLGPTTPQPLLLKVPEVARLLQMSRSAVYNLMERGALPYVKILSTRRVEFAAVQKLIDESRVGPSSL